MSIEEFGKLPAFQQAVIILLERILKEIKSEEP
jgi:hypothetical protein